MDDDNFIDVLLSYNLPITAELVITKKMSEQSDVLLKSSATIPNMEWIYFIWCGNRIKIGKAFNVRQRLCELQVGNPYELVLIGLMETKDDQTEASFHHRFAKHRVRGEWFIAHDEVKNFIAENSWRL